MTPIELEASLLLQGSPARKGFPLTYDISRAHAIEALCRALERREAFKQEVSEEMEYLLYWVESGEQWHGRQKDGLARFILPKPDLLVEALNEARVAGPYSETETLADRLRDALAARGLKIVEADA